MSQELMLDTNIVSYFLNGNPMGEPYKAHLRGRDLAISFATLAELHRLAYRKNHEWGQAKLDTLATEIEQYSVLWCNPEICLAWAEIRGTMGISENDAWIAATALVNGCALVTHDAVFSDPALQNLGLSVITESGA